MSNNSQNETKSQEKYSKIESKENSDEQQKKNVPKKNIKKKPKRYMFVSFYHLLLRKIALFRMFKSGCRMTRFSQKSNKFGVYVTK